MTHFRTIDSIFQPGLVFQSKIESVRSLWNTLQSEQWCKSGRLVYFENDLFIS